MNQKQSAIEMLRGWSIWLIAGGVAIGIPSTLPKPYSWWLFPLAFVLLFWIAHKMGQAIERVEKLLNSDAV